MKYLIFSCPPIPHFLVSWNDVMPAGKQHAARQSIGVFDMLYIVEGTMYIKEEHSTWELKNGDFLVLRPDCLHGGTKACPVDTYYFWLHFQTLGQWEISDSVQQPNLNVNSAETYMDPLQPYQLTIPRHKRTGHPEMLNKIFQEIRILNFSLTTQTKFQQQQLFQKILMELAIQEATIPNTAANSLALATASYIKSHYHEHITYQSLESKFNFHMNYITRCFIETFGCTPHNYLTQLRIDIAKQLLENSHDDIWTIAEKCGFTNDSNFIKSFSMNVGTTPKKYRKINSAPLY